jgi:hypothetical protein
MKLPTGIQTLDIADLVINAKYLTQFYQNCLQRPERLTHGGTKDHHARACQRRDEC